MKIAKSFLTASLTVFNIPFCGLKNVSTFRSYQLEKNRKASNSNASLEIFPFMALVYGLHLFSNYTFICVTADGSEVTGPDI